MLFLCLFMISKKGMVRGGVGFNTTKRGQSGGYLKMSVGLLCMTFFDITSNGLGLRHGIEMAHADFLRS